MSNKNLSIIRVYGEYIPRNSFSFKEINEKFVPLLLEQRMEKINFPINKEKNLAIVKESLKAISLDLTINE